MQEAAAYIQQALRVPRVVINAAFLSHLDLVRITFALRDAYSVQLRDAVDTRARCWPGRDCGRCSNCRRLAAQAKATCEAWR